MSKRIRERLSLAAFLLLSLAVLVLADGARAQTYYGTALVKPNTTVSNCGTWAASGGGAVNALTDSGVGCANNQITISDGSHGTMTIAPTVFGTPNSPAILNTTSQQPLIFAHTVRTGTDAGDFKCVRDANYTGGTSGFVNPCFYSYTIARAGIGSFEWSFLSRLDNYATASPYTENVGAYFQGRKYSTGATWGAVSELYDYTGDPSTSSSVHEFDIRMTGTDTVGGGGRVGIDLFGTSNTAGSPAVARHGFRINTDADSTFTNVFETNGNFTNGFTTVGGTFTGPAFAMAAGQKWCLDGLTCSNYVSQASNQLHFWANGTDVTDMTALGTASVALNATVGGIGLPAGQKLCLDTQATCQNYVTDTSGVLHFFASNTDSAQVSSLGTNVLALNTTAGGIGLPATKKLCFDGTTCSYYATLNGSNILQFTTASGTAAQINGLQTNLLATTVTSLDGTGHITTTGDGSTFGSGSDGPIKLLLKGATKGARVYTSSSATTIEGVDNTGLASYQPLVLGGSAVKVSLSGGTANDVVTTGGGQTIGGNVGVTSGSKVCLDGSTCSIYVSYDGASTVRIVAGSINLLSMNTSTGNVAADVGKTFSVGFSTGVSCSGAPTASFAVTGGIVTHC